MTTALLRHSDCLNHVTPPGHPERVDRLRAIEAALAETRFDALHREDAPIGTDDEIRLAHPQHHIDAMEAISPDSEFAAIDGDTFQSPGSMMAARRAVGGNVRAVDLVLSGAAKNAFVACRPPGHHAETAQAMGFCLFGNAVVAARHAMAVHGLSRVAIVDFDVHHGNGTQDLVWNDDRILFVSSHQMPLYPGSGRPDERGAHGQVVNIPLAPDTGGDLIRQHMSDTILPAVAAHEPELILISAGFDSHQDDPLGGLNWTAGDFGWLTGQLCDAADTLCDGRVVSTLEGGYDLDGLASSVAEHVAVLMERDQ